ncbi:uncharacterized protein G2W53_003729 [Senna tora]|uniref:Uncharacterized protein n=1 Tax=Senna tora TaxID=362788 RepID=A0A834XAG4_9FABA|nr:uncharacterized protein G2W53_003729 [Senna tora]
MDEKPMAVITWIQDLKLWFKNGVSLVSCKHIIAYHKIKREVRKKNPQRMHSEGSQPMEGQGEQISYRDSIQNVNRGLEFEENKFEGEELEEIQKTSLIPQVKRQI